MTHIHTQTAQIVSVHPIVVPQIAPAMPKTLSNFVAADADATGEMKRAWELLSMVLADKAGVVVIQ